MAIKDAMPNPKKVKKKRLSKVSPRLLKNYTFSQLATLIQQAKQKKNKDQLTKYKSLVHQKELNWANSLLKGQQKLFEQQQFKRTKKQAQINKELAKKAHKERLTEIYTYFRQELNRTNKTKSPYFTAQLDLEPTLAKELARKQKQVPEYDFYAEFRRKKKHLTYKLNKKGQIHLLQQTQHAYHEELEDQKSQIRYYQDRAGLTKINPQHLIKKGQKIKLFFPDKGEHKEFFKKNKEFKQLWEKFLISAPDPTKTEELSKKLYEKSPLRIRDRNLQAPQKKGDKYYFVSGDDFVIPRNQSVFDNKKEEESNLSQVFQKYYKENPFEPTKKHYRNAITEILRKPLFTGEVVPESEIELNKHNWPKLKEGQVMSVDIANAKPGRSWSLRKNVPTLKQIIKEKVHEVAHEGYVEEYGTALEKQVFKSIKSDKFLCRVEAIEGRSCSDKGSNDWCIFCVRLGPYHPPVLPIHCDWLYTYKSGTCGTQEHPDANKQWHFSREGERTRSAIKGGDWGSCHMARFDAGKKGKIRRR